MSVTIANVKIRSERRNLHFGRTSAAVVIDDLTAYKTLCPISKVTGCRVSPLSLLKTLANDPAKSRIVNAIIQELPNMPSMDGMSNDEMLSMLGDSFNLGSFFENDVERQRLANIVSDAVDAYKAANSFLPITRTLILLCLPFSRIDCNILIRMISTVSSNKA